MEIGKQNLTAIVVGLACVSFSVSLRADSVLPTATFYCENENSGPTGNCSGSGTQLPSVNGIQGVGMNFSASSSGSDVLETQFAIIGALSGDNLSAGTLIPYSFSFTATSTNLGGTEITNYIFDPTALYAFPPDSNVPPPILGESVSQSSTVTVNGNCSGGPSGPTNTCWSLSVTGTGVFEFSNTVPSGAVVEIPLYTEIDTGNLLGSPNITISGTINFNPVPEQRYSTLAVVGGGFALLLYRRRRTGLRASLP